ncbi:hypothetical protein P7C73_g3932, partial [Tremellales sp. Uapishka_1]
MPDPRRTLVLICDVQERFRTVERPAALPLADHAVAGSAIHGFDAVTATIAKMVKAAQVSSSFVSPEPSLVYEMTSCWRCPSSPQNRTQAVGYPLLAFSLLVLITDSPAALGTTVPELGLASLPPSLNLGVFSKTQVSPPFPASGPLLTLHASQFSMVVPSVQRALDEVETRGTRFDNYIVVGIEAHVCVLQTTLGLLGASTMRNVFVLADGISSCNRQEVPIAIQRMRQAGAKITTSESILFQMMGDASSPHFKPFAALIKAEKEKTKDALGTLLDDLDPWTQV